MLGRDVGGHDRCGVLSGSVLASKARADAGNGGDGGGIVEKEPDAQRVTDTLRNFTPHRVLIYQPDGGVPVTLPQMGNVRLAEHYVDGGLLPNGLPCSHLHYGKPSGLPEPQPGVILIVSQLVANALAERDDLVFPAGLTRNDDGDIAGFRYLARPAPEAEAATPSHDGREEAS